jgi:hypothetical protein
MERLYEECEYMTEYDEEIIPSIIEYVLSIAKLFSM